MIWCTTVLHDILVLELRVLLRLRVLRLTRVDHSVSATHQAPLRQQASRVAIASVLDKPTHCRMPNTHTRHTACHTHQLHYQRPTTYWRQTHITSTPHSARHYCVYYQQHTIISKWSPLTVYSTPSQGQVRSGAADTPVQQETDYQSINQSEDCLGSVGIDRNVWNFANALKLKTNFHSKMSVCRHTQGGGFNTPTTPSQQFQPCV